MIWLPLADLVTDHFASLIFDQRLAYPLGTYEGIHVGEPMTDRKIIKRYANRKLYDTQRSCYVTLDEIAQMVKSYEDVRIIDNRTGEDLTGVTLTQIIYEDQKRADQKRGLPLSALRNIIASGEEMFAKFSPGLSKPNFGWRQDRASRRQVTYDLPEAAQRRAKLDQARKTSPEASSEAHLDAIYSRLEELEKTSEQMEKQLRSIHKLVKEIRDDMRSGGNKRGPHMPPQKSKPTLPL